MNNPTTIVIFGATGDLFRKKLAFALYGLFARGQMPKVFRVVAFSRRPWGHEEFRQFLSDTLREKSVDMPPETLKNFLEHFLYVEGDLGNLASYQKTAGLLGKLDSETGVCMNKLFYLATPPTSYEEILNHISTSGLAIPCATAKGISEVGPAPLEAEARFDASSALTGWTRILIEKPFGSDLKDALRLDRLLGELFSEAQIFRIDHYLAKEVFQNLMTLRFSKSSLEHLWDRNHIDKVEIKLFEKDGVVNRGSFYDTLGALRDVGQNHALQMAALVGMENPGKISSESVRQKRAEALQKFKVKGQALRGQYEGYQNEAGVVPHSQTETYFKMELALSTPRFRSVPFTIEAGKGLSESKAEIIVYFKKVADFVCPPGVRCEKDTVIFRAESPKSDKKLLDGYEKVLLDAIKGDQTLFTSTEEVIAEWNIVMPILAAWRKAATPPLKYPKGTMPQV